MSWWGGGEERVEGSTLSVGVNNISLFLPDLSWSFWPWWIQRQQTMPGWCRLFCMGWSGHVHNNRHALFYAISMGLLECQIQQHTLAAQVFTARLASPRAWIVRHVLQAVCHQIANTRGTRLNPTPLSRDATMLPHLLWYAQPCIYVWGYMILCVHVCVCVCEGG